jgi:hypothetical protein
MGREVRRVPADWQHPRDQGGRFIPLREHFPYNEEEIAEGLRDGWLRNEPPHYGVSVMPGFPEGSATHYVMYENTSEGTPISPAFATPEELAHWLADTRASAFAGMAATYEEWLTVCRGRPAPSAIITPDGVLPGTKGLG